MVMRPAPRMNERHGYRLWVKVVAIAVLVAAGFFAGRATAHADNGDGESGTGNLVCAQSRLGEDPGQIAADLHAGDPRYSIWQTTQQTWSGLQDCD